MTELDIHEVKKKSARGILALIQRSFILQLITSVSTFAQLAFLTQRDLGIFGIVNAFIGFLNYFSDIGLAAALIQKKEKITDEDLSTTFTIQQIMVGGLVLLGLLFSETIAHFFGLDQSGVWLLRALLVAFLLSSLKTIPTILLERNLEFSKMVIPQLIEGISYNVAIVIFAWQGFGVWSFTYAVLIRGILGLMSTYIVSPWRIRVHISLPVAKRLFKFGIPFQSNSFLALLKDDLLFLVLAKLITIEQIGYITTAKRLAELPLRSIMDNVMRVTFPAFSRLQHDVKLLVKALETATFGLALIVFPLYVGMIFFIQPFMELVPRYQKWEGALLSFYFLCVTSIAASLSTPLTNALNAIGKIKITLGLMIMWIVLTWILVLIFVHLIGYHGFALALMIISWTVFVVVYIVKKYIPITFLPQIKFQIVGVMLQSLFYVLILPRVPHTFIILPIVGLIGVAVYVFILWHFEKVRIMQLITTFKHR